MSHAVSLGFEVSLIVFVGSGLDGDILYDFQSVGLQSDTFYGVVCHQAHFVYTEMAQHLCSAAIVALVGFESEVSVGIDGVVALLLLELVGGNLVHQSDAAALLLHVDEHTFALLLDHLHGLVKLVAAVAALRSEDVAGGAGGVDTYEDRLFFVPFTLDEGHVLQSVACLAERNEMEVTVFCRQVYLFTYFYQRLFLSRYSIMSLMEMTFNPHSLANFRSCGRRAMVPSSFMISISAPAG